MEQSEARSGLRARVGDGRPAGGHSSRLYASGYRGPVSRLSAKIKSYAPVPEYWLNEFAARIPFAGARMGLYAALGVTLDPASTLIMMRTVVRQPSGIELREGATIGRDCFLDGRGGLVVDRNANISSFCRLITGTHDPHDVGFPASFHPIHIGEGAWLGSGVTVLPGCRVGAGAVVAAGAVVTRDLEAMMIHRGIPATPYRPREADPTGQPAMRYRPNWF
jgi:acetyltransferase-like isoleucine patch superfamily enzyme